jgi:AhpD family alkylhydroperoxidase
MTMSENKHNISNAFLTFHQEAPQFSGAWGKMIQEVSQASALDPKTKELAYLAVLAVQRLESGIPFHVKAAKNAGASREEIISAILVGLSAAGHVVTQVLPAALEAYDQDG